MITRGSLIVSVALGAVCGVAFVQWRITTPGVVTDAEWHALLLLGGIALVFVLCAHWVGSGRPPIDTRRSSHTRSENQRRIRPPWA